MADVPLKPPPSPKGSDQLYKEWLEDVYRDRNESEWPKKVWTAILIAMVIGLWVKACSDGVIPFG